MYYGCRRDSYNIHVENIGNVPHHHVLLILWCIISVLASNETRSIDPDTSSAIQPLQMGVPKAHLSEHPYFSEGNWTNTTCRGIQTKSECILWGYKQHTITSCWADIHETTATPQDVNSGNRYKDRPYRIYLETGWCAIVSQWGPVPRNPRQ